MARLIDATRIEQFILNNCSDNEEINTIYGEIINAPTIDLVRCEECKFVGTDATCCLVCCRDGMGLKPYHVYHDDFCSYGERRTDE